jgi:hypothetical protein
MKPTVQAQENLVDTLFGEAILRKQLSLPISPFVSLSNKTIRPSINLQRRQVEVEEIARANGISLPFVTHLPNMYEAQVIEGTETDMVMMPLSLDPLYHTFNNRLVAPKHVIKEFNRINKSGISFDNIVIAHEIPKGSVKNGQQVSIEVLMPPLTRAQSQRLNILQKGVSGFWKGVSFVAAGIGLATAAVSVAAVGIGLGGLGLAAGAAGGFASGLDPVVFGLLFDPNHDDKNSIAAWYYITSWYWE